jgi:hypothetical protein
MKVEVSLVGDGGLLKGGFDEQFHSSIKEGRDTQNLC